ncbi:hypothetical protein PsorP6_008813 [Peronosclerospora sorghi]|uniref:Uncharacterized protein n=1 Tax=Peronosclerospora sorghi TaxID=230839 RepID=A0ACC0VXB3_9STRA|nr:hypothetical protein PsorP6_008813 [Peronosclerospora sorghi]
MTTKLKLRLSTGSPKFTYHAFGTDERIDGYSELKFSVNFNGYDFRTLLIVEFKEKEPTCVVAKLKPSLPQSFFLEQDEFVIALRKAAIEFTGPPGICFESYTTTTIVENGERNEIRRYLEIYECKLEDNESAQKLLTNLQTLPLWFIEGLNSLVAM